ncbi:mechanosensitive ion channel family protein [Mycolicibacter algericus]|nr:mechanosensitive ion channel family protein [Mycolicibacter algericus]OQZ99482.1 mechanosensitive ion channel protein MscS [Mycolicibacter algericus DSM 45454]
MATEPMVSAFSPGQRWHDAWSGEIGQWVIDKGLRIVLLLIGAVLASRLITWAARRVTRRLELGFQTSDALVRSEASKHRQAVASVISWVSVVMLCVVVAVQITGILDIPIGSLVGPAAVIGGAIGFGAQKLVQDLLSGFFIITERQYGFGDLVQLSMIGASVEALGTVEDVTLRVTKLRTADGEVFTVPNGNIVRSLNLSKDWARAVVDIPVPTSADLNRVNEVLHQVCENAMEADAPLRDLLLDTPSIMGVESIELGVVNLRMVARTLPGKQFEVGRRLRIQVVRALASAGVVTAGEVQPVETP